MFRNVASTTGGASAGPGIKANASPESKAWLGAVLQTVREGSAVDVQSLLADLRADGHIVPAAEAEMVDDFEHNADPELDAEAAAFVRTIRFAPSEQNLQWGTITFYWSDDAFADAPR